MFRLLRFSLVSLTLALTPYAALTAQDAPQPLNPDAYAALTADGAFILAQAGGAIVIEADQPDISGGVWLPDMQRFAFPTETGSAFVADTAGTLTPLALDGQLEPGFPLGLGLDGSILYVTGGDFMSGGDYRITLHRIAPEAGAVSQTLGETPYTVGCGGASMDPTDWRLWGERGFGGNPHLLAETADGIVYTSFCGASELAVFDPATGETRPLTPNALVNPFGKRPVSALQAVSTFYTRPALSPDGSAIALVAFDPNAANSFSAAGQVVLLDVATGALTPVPTSASAETVAWGPNGSLFYSTRTRVNDLTAQLDPAARERVATQGFGFVGEVGADFGVPAYEIALFQIDPVSGEETAVFNVYASNIGTMTMNRDASALYFTTVANLDAWVSAIVAGTFDPMTADRETAFALIPVNAYRLPIVGGVPTLGGEDPLVGALAQFTVAR
jgi:hypothetical protein